jgi:peptidoglycan/LPS O-acetylase OafA/YrhL
LALGRNQALDGLRAVAVIAVILVHAFRGKAFTGGFVGVDIFFVLSGYLITTLFLAEQNATGRISLIKFYLRRILRLTPALWLVIAFCALLLFRSAKAHDQFLAIVAAGTYAMNWALMFDTSEGWILLHTWSLSIEEQFYLLWPAVLILAMRVNEQSGPAWVAFACLAISTLVSVYLTVSGYSPADIYYGFETRSSELFVGCVLATTTLPGSVQVAAARLWFVPVIALTCVLLFAQWESRWLGLGGFQLIAFAAAWLIVAARKDNVLADTLRLPALVYVGRISYGIYLWHFVLLQLFHARLGATLAATIGIPLSFLLAAASFEFIERPILRYSHRHFAARPRPSETTLMPGHLAKTQVLIALGDV